MGSIPPKMPPAPPRHRIATRNGRPAYLIPLVRSSQPVTNHEWFERQRAQRRGPDIFETLFARLLRKVGR